MAPDTLLSHGDMKSLVVDTGANFSMSSFRMDFVQGSLRKLSNPITFDGIAGQQTATHEGTACYETFDDKGNLIVLESCTLFLPGLRCQLFSPQCLFDDL